MEDDEPVWVGDETRTGKVIDSESDWARVRKEIGGVGSVIVSLTEHIIQVERFACMSSMPWRAVRTGQDSSTSALRLALQRDPSDGRPNAHGDEFPRHRRLGDSGTVSEDSTRWTTPNGSLRLLAESGG